MMLLPEHVRAVNKDVLKLMPLLVGTYPLQPIFTTYLLNPPSQPTSSTHLLNLPPQPTFSPHLLNTLQYGKKATRRIEIIRVTIFSRCSSPCTQTFSSYTYFLILLFLILLYQCSSILSFCRFHL